MWPELAVAISAALDSRQEDHVIDRLEERVVEKGNGGRFSLGDAGGRCQSGQRWNRFTGNTGGN